MWSRSHEEIRTLQSKPAQCFGKYRGLGFRGLGFLGLEPGLLLFFFRDCSLGKGVCLFPRNQNLSLLYLVLRGAGK